MKKSELKQIIKEELKKVLNEDENNKFNIAGKPHIFGVMLKNIITKEPDRKYLVIDGFDGNELYGRISNQPIK